MVIEFVLAMQSPLHVLGQEYFTSLLCEQIFNFLTGGFSSSHLQFFIFLFKVNVFSRFSSSSHKTCLTDSTLGS